MPDDGSAYAKSRSATAGTVGTQYGGPFGVLQNEIMPPAQPDQLVTGKELRDGIAIRSRGDLVLIEQYEMIPAVPAFNQSKSPSRAV